MQESAAALLARPGSYRQTDLRHLNIPWFESPFFAAFLRETNLPADQKALVEQFAEDGYLMFDVERKDFATLADGIIGGLADRYQGHRRIQDVWQFHTDVRALACDLQVLALLRLLYQREPIPFQTLNFPVGTEQQTHSDTVHFHCIPHRFMCGVWIAFEDIDAENGPLHVYPGSHKLPVWNFNDLGLPAEPGHYHAYEQWIARMVETLGLPKKSVQICKGQAIIWAANVLHGGDRILDPRRSRHSQVTHYYFENCLYYTPMLSEPYLGKMHLRTIQDIRTGEVVPNRYNGEVVTPVPPTPSPTSTRRTISSLTPLVRKVLRCLKRG